MSKVNINSDERAVETSDNELYRRNLDGTYTKITFGGAAAVYQTGSDVPPPEAWYANAQYETALAAAGTLTGLTNFRKYTIVISGLTSETVSITGLIGPNQDVETAALRPVDANTGAVAAASALGNGTYQFTDLAVHQMKFTKSAASETVTITVTGKA